MTDAQAPIPQDAPAPQMPLQKTSNLFATVALITGIVAFLTGLVPVWGLLIGATAVVFAVLAIFRKQSKPFAIVGGVLGATAFLASLVTTLLLVVGLVAGAGSATNVSETPSVDNEAASSLPPLETSAPVADPAETAEAEAEAEAEPEPAVASETISQQNAVQTAEDYLDYSAFSRTGLIKQLEFEGYPKADATYAVDAVGADWNVQAVASAKSYLEYSSFSHKGLVDQLIFEGFTKAEAEHGVTSNGL